MISFDDLIGKPFVFGGWGPDSYDCWGLAIEICRRLDIMIPDFGAGCEFLASEIHRTGESFEDRFSPVKTPMPGDIIAFRYPLPMYVGHIGVSIGQTYFMHTRQVTSVVRDLITKPVWKKRIHGIYRYTSN